MFHQTIKNHDLATTELNQMTIFNLLPFSFLDIAISSFKVQKQIVGYIAFTYKILQKTCAAFLNKDYLSFDAIVGENACQLRSILFTSEKFSAKNIDSEINRVSLNVSGNLKRLEELIDINLCLRNSKPKVSDFINHWQLDLKTSKELFFLASCYILTLIKQKSENECGINIETINYKNLNLIFPELSGQYALSITHHLQKFISHLSIKFIQQLSESNETNHELRHLLSMKYIYLDDNSRSLLPFSMTIIYLLHYLSTTKTYLLIKCHHIIDNKKSIIYRLFKSKKSKSSFFPDFTEIFINQESIDIPLIVVEGMQKSSYFNPDFFDELSSVIIKNAWHHPLYTKEINDFTVKKTNLWIYINNKIKNVTGCLREDSSRFFIFHIYANTLKSEFNC